MNTKYIKMGLTIFVLSMMTKLDAQNPSWFDKVSVLSGVVPSVAPTVGGTWGHHSRNPTWIAGQVEYWHSKGGFYHAYMTFHNGQSNNVKQVDDSMACIDLNGNPILFEVDDSGIYHYIANLHSRAYQDSLIKIVKRVIDVGADGVVIDGTAPNVWIIMNEPAGSFDEYTMKDFREYLENKYTSAELTSKFNITDISTFNFGEWIKRNGLESTWNKWPLKGLCNEYLIFEWKFAKNFLALFVQSAKDYSSTQYGRNFLVAENGANAYYVNIDQIDCQVNEFFYFDRPFLTYASSFTKLRKTLNNKPVVILPEVADGQTGYNLVQNSKNMIKHVLSDIYGSGGIAVVYDEFWCPQHYQNSYYYDTDILKRYTTFILNSPDLFEELETEPKVGLIYSYTSTIHNNWWHYAGSYSGMSKLLIDANIQHDPIFVNGPPISDVPELSAELLSQYDCIVLPNVHSMSDYQESQFRQYMSNGGIIIASGETCTKNENGEDYIRPSWQALKSEGTHSYGKGYFIYFIEDIGESYTYGKNLKYKKIISDEIKKYVMPETVIDNDNAPSAFLYNKYGRTTKVMHMVNYDYNPNTDSFRIKENFSTKVLVDTAKNWEAVYLSPDFAGRELLKTSISNGYLSFTIPYLEAYGIVVIQENQSLPAILNNSPKADTTVVAGASIQFSVTATDPDDNILYYKWFVNSKLDSLSNNNLFNYQTSMDASGIDTIMVEVSDGRNNIIKKWYLHLREYIRPKVLFDEAHDNRNSISLERAKILYPDHPEYIYWGIIKNKMETKFTFDSNRDSLLSNNLLSSYHALIISSPDKNFTSTEIKNIRSFVIQGGGLFIVLDCGINSCLHQLLLNFGVTQLDGVVFDNTYGGNLSVTDFIDSAGWLNTQKFQMNWGGSLLVTEPSVSVLQSSNESWRDTNWNGIEENNEPNGPFTIMCVAEYGKGKFCCISDNSFHDDYVKWEESQNDELFINIVNWLTSQLNEIQTNIDQIDDIPQKISLYQNYPNPFNPSTKISYNIYKPGLVNIHIYNLLGQRVRTLTNNNNLVGEQSVIWDGNDDFGVRVAGGIYIYQLKANNCILNKKLLLLK